MKEFAEKLIGRLLLESSGCKVYKLINPNKEDVAEFNAYKKCIEIVNQLAEEYKPQLNDNDLMIVESLPSLYPMKEFEEEALQRVIGCAKKEYNNGWIPCEKELPKENVCDDGWVEPSDAVLVFTKYGSFRVSRYWGNRRNKRDYYDWVDIEYRQNEVLAWMPLPAPFKKGSE